MTTRTPNCDRSRASGSVIDDDAALGRGVGLLPDLAVEAATEAVNDDAALAVGRKRIELTISGRNNRVTL